MIIHLDAESIASTLGVDVCFMICWYLGCICVVWAYLQDVARLSTAHIDWSSHEVAAAGAVWAPHVDLGASLHIIACVWI